MTEEGERKKDFWKIKTPAQLQFVGPSQSGKSTKLLALVEQDHRLFDREFKQVIYAAPNVREDSEFCLELRKICQARGKRLQVADAIPNLPAIREEYSEGDVLLLLDDLICFPTLGGLSELSSLHAHHARITCVYCVQNPYARPGTRNELTTVNRNLTGRFLFYQLNDWRLYQILNTSLFPDCKNFLTRCLTDAKAKSLNYVFVNTHSFGDLPRRFICYTGLFEGETEDGRPLFFDLDKAMHTNKGHAVRANV